MKTKEEKKEILQKLKEKLAKTKSFILIDLTNLKAEIEKTFRDLLKTKGCQFEVVKKSLLYKATENFPFSDEELKKPFAVLWDFQDGLTVFRSLLEGKKNLEFNFNVLGGYFEGKKLNQAEVWEIAKLPGKEELISKIAFSLSLLPQKLAFSLNFPLQKLTFALSAIKNKK